MFQTDKSLPRGYRNNNPLNIRISNTAWFKKIPLSRNSDGEFEQFEGMKYGYRAALLNVRTQVNRGNDTIRKLIQVWAPDSDGNNSSRYIERICESTGYTPDTVIDPSNRTMMENLVRAMSIVENGPTPAPDEKAISQGYDLTHLRF